MKRLLTVSFLMMTLTIFAPTMARADTPAGQNQINHNVAGLWQNVPDGDAKEAGTLEVTLDDNQAMSVKIVKIASNYKEPRCIKCKDELKNAPIIGLYVLKNLPLKAPGEWTGGKILDPESGNFYSVKITLIENGNKIKVRGYIGAPMFGRTQYWVKAK